ncbi:MAG: hypothetical protein ACK5D5_02845 [Bacteroidota bacterium]|jgi:hypothetical protein
MKDFIYTIIVLSVVVGLYNHLLNKKKENGFLKKLEFYKRKAELENLHSKNRTKNEKIKKRIHTSEKTNTNVIYVRALGQIDSGDIEFAEEVIRDFFNYKVYLLPPIPLSEEMYNKDGYMDSSNALLAIKEDRKIINVIDKEVYQEGKLLRGVASGDEKTIIIRGEKRFMKETIIHEIGHTLGLDHCDDLSCVMALNNDQFDSGRFCSNCKQKLDHHHQLIIKN